MESRQVFIKRVISANGKVVSEIKNVTTTSDDGSKIRQDISVQVSSDNNSSSSSQSGHISISCNQ